MEIKFFAWPFYLYTYLAASNCLAQEPRLIRSYNCQEKNLITHYRYGPDGFLDRIVNWDSSFVYYYDGLGRPFEAYSITTGVTRREEKYVWTEGNRFDKFLGEDSVSLAYGIIFNRRKNSLDGDSVWQYRRDSVKVGVWRFYWNEKGLLDSTVNEWLESAPELMQKNIYQHISADSVIRTTTYGMGINSTCFVDIYEATPVIIRREGRIRNRPDLANRKNSFRDLLGRMTKATGFLISM